ncbi:uncharacterized protein LOC133521049 [Cydia pomonella]|uniref:uncharacterized protein LOC133521049 n=1 Tax=Cydia pomonella TaxID=82600 RepID=UPI002ADD9147|nr:uncharacterized protein LOC133521049 [Cydia pomonella]
MFSKLYNSATVAWRPALPALMGPRYTTHSFLAPRAPSQVPTRFMNFGLASQYSNNRIPDRLRMMYAMKHYWETIPLFVVCIFDVIIVFAACLYACKSRVELQFVHSRNNSISRTMDMRYPTVHKHLVLHQRYEPWPELQDVLDKMTAAEKRLKTRMDSCKTP